MLRWAGRFWTGVLLVVVIACAVLLGLRCLLPLLPFSPRPTLQATFPLSGASGVAPRSQLTLQFSTAMNPRSVERALQFEPAAPLAFAWSADSATLAISPTEPLDPGQNYTLTLGENAQSRWYRELEAPITLRFAIAPAPAVRSAFPQPGASDVPLDAAISLHFSRPIVAADRVGAPLDMPLVRFEPAIQGVTIWLDPATALFQPATPLQAGTVYTATVEAGLLDANGGELAQPYSWSFSTPAPRLLSIVPTDGAERVALHDRLVLHVSQSFPLQRLQAALTISPTVAGVFSQAILPDATQVVTFTPSTAFRPDTTYTIALAPGLLPDQGTIPLPASTSRFTSTPQPVLTGRFPGEGQLLPSGQELRLIFNTPIDGVSLRARLRFEPPIEPDTVVVSGNEARIGAPFAAATVYTATVAADVADLAGAVLGRPYQLRFQTAPAAPALVLLDTQGHAVQIASSEPGPRFRRTNITQFDAAVYPLDEDSTVRLLSFGDRDWRDFSAERAGLVLLRQWSQTFTDTLNTPIDSRLPLLDAAQVSSGSYYLRLRTPDGLRQDAVVFVGDTHLVVQRSPTDLLVWATAAGVPIEGAPLVAYRNGSLLGRGQTGPDGTWRLSAATAGSEPLLVLGQGNLALAEALPPTAQLRAVLIADRANYLAGDTVQLSGFVRVVDNAAPPADLRGTLTLRSRASSQRVASVPIEIGSSGVISTNLELPAVLPIGDYLLALNLGSQLFSHEITIVAPHPPPTLTLDLLAASVNGAPLEMKLVGRTAENLPLASVPVSWTVHFEPLNSFGDRYAIGEAPMMPAPFEGAGLLGRDGTLAVVISNTLDITTPLRLLAEARAATASGAVATTSGSGLVLPSAQTIGIALASRVVQASQPISVELLVRGFDAAPRTNQAVTVELYRATAGGVPTEPAARRRARVFARNARTGDDGRASVAIALPSAGEYQLVASAIDADNRPTRTLLPLWATAANFAGWPAPQADLRLVADQPKYQPGDTARLLVPAAIEPGTALVSVRRGQRLEATVQPVQAGSVITVAVGAESPLLPVAIQFANQPGLSASALLPVAPDDSLHVAVASDTATYAPGATATFTVTTTDRSGRGVPADVVVGLNDQPGQSAVQFELDEASVGVGNQESGVRDSQPRSGTTIAWLPGLRTDATGVLTVTARLPNQAQSLVAQVWVAGDAGQLAYGRTTVAITQPLALALELPPNLRAGDTIEVRARVRNPANAPIEPRLVLTPQGLDVISGDLSRSLALAAGQETMLTWQARVEPVSQVRVRLNTQLVGNRQIELERPVLNTNPPGPPGSLVNGAWNTRFERNADVPLEIAIVSSRAALGQSLLESIGSLPTQNPADSAALLLTTPEPTGVLARQAVAELASDQEPDGGWSWWPGEASDPELTLFVLESLAARAAGPTSATLAQPALQLLASQTGSAAQARAVYAQSLFGEADATRIATLARAPQSLDSASIALLLLARPPDAARDRVLVDVLLQRVVRDQRGSSFRGTTYGGDLNTTALVARALAVARPSSPLLDELRQFIAAAYTIDGWPNSLIAARATAALNPILPTAARPPTIMLNGRTLPTPSSVPSSTLRLLVGPQQLEATNLLTTTIDSGPALVAYRIGSKNQATAALLLRREYLDPDTRQPIDPAKLQVGQLVEVRLTVVANQSVEHVVMQEALPGGMLLAPNETSQRRFGASRVEPGVYQYRYTLQAAAVGSFQAPAPIARLSDGTLAGIGDSSTITISR